MACSCLVAAQAGLSVNASDVSVYLVKKGQEYTQIDSSGPSVNATNGYVFEVDVVMSGINTVTSAAIQPPGVPVLQLAPSTGNKWSFKHKVNKLTKLDQLYPNGRYVYLITGKSDGLRQPGLQLQGSVYPNGPSFHNFPATQAVNANGYFTLAWDAFNAATTNDFMQVRIEDLQGNKLFETPDLGKDGFWDGTPTQVLVAPGKLTSGQTNRVTLTFQKAVTIDQSSYPGALGEAAYFARTTFFLSTTKALGPVTKRYEIAKVRQWVQTNSTPPIPEAGQEFVFNASIQANVPGALSGASLTLAPTTNAPSRNLALQPGGTKLDFSDAASTAATLDSFYAVGKYTLTFPTSSDGNKTLAVSLPTNNFPPPPRISDFAALQPVDASQPFSVSWDAWGGGTINDLVQVRIEDTNGNKFFETPDLGKSGALDGRATSVVVPAGTLPTGQVFQVRVTFTHVNTVDISSYPGVLGLSDFQARTKMNIQTALGPRTPPTLTLTHDSSGPGYRLAAPAAPNVSYRIDGSSNLFQWFPLTTNTPLNGLLQWHDPMERGSFFYRAVSQ